MRIKIPCTSDDCLSSNESNGIWSNRHAEISFSMLQKFWSELPLQARKELLKVDKQTLFEHARKNMYCSRCNGLLLEFYVQIVAHGKSIPQVGADTGALKNEKNVDCLGNQSQDDLRDAILRPWGGLVATRDGCLALLDCYLGSKSVKTLQNVFDSARVRERERELLYPDGCGGGGRGWISQGVGSYGRGHGTRDACALHTARLSCDTFVDFWSALGEETQHSLLRMKEEDFVERLMFRFDSKRFCRDCRKNVIREFKELKELKRCRKETRCTRWFCAADTAFQYEVSDDMVQADWRRTFGDSLEIYHHFEWAVGTGQGKSDILDFENVGMNRSVCVDGLDLCGLNACFITLRAWRIDGRCSELSVKAHALRGLQCVHSRLVVGDGYVSITSRESIRRFFEHAEEAEDEEDDESMERDGSDLDGECSRPQKHAKSPELAREFLLDAATVIFKKQIEKAFREGTARQNAHVMFISLALKTLEERLHVACKEIITLEKQMKLLEEEEMEKREERERKERRKAKDKEKKQRRKERLRGKEKDKEKCDSETNLSSSVLDAQQEESIPSFEDHNSNALSYRDSAIETVNIMSKPASPGAQYEQPADGYVTLNVQLDYDSSTTVKDGSDSFIVEDSNYTARRQQHQRDAQWDSKLEFSERRRFSAVSENGYSANRSELRYYSDNCETPSRAIIGSNDQTKFSSTKSSARSSDLNYSEKIPCSRNRTDKYNGHSCRCNRDSEHVAKAQLFSAAATDREFKSTRKLESEWGVSNQFNHGYNYTQAGDVYENRGRTKRKLIFGNPIEDSHDSKGVWEPLETPKKYSNIEGMEADVDIINSSNPCSSEVGENSDDRNCEDKDLKGSRNPSLEKSTYFQNGLQEDNDICYLKEPTEKLIEGSDALKTSPLITAHQSSTSNSDAFSSSLSEGDSNTSSSNLNNTETSSTSESEDANQLEDEGETSRIIQSGLSEFRNDRMVEKQVKKGEQSPGVRTSFGFSQNGVVSDLSGHLPTQTAPHYDNGKASNGVASQPQDILSQVYNPYISFPMFHAPPPMVYYQQPQVTWPVNPANGFLHLPHHNQYLYAGSLGYGFNGNSGFFMQPSQDIASPLSYTALPPVYRTVSRFTRMTNVEKHENCIPVQQQANKPKREELIAAGLHSTEAPSRREDAINSSDTKHDDNSKFSFFQFGSHLPLSIANKSGHVLSKAEIIGEICAKFQHGYGEANESHDKKETTSEEYKLFGLSNDYNFFAF